MKYCKSCKQVVQTGVKFNKQDMAYSYCIECDSYLSYEDDDEDDADYYEAGFMNDFGDSN